MDEFAELEKELLETENSSDASLQDVLNLLKNGKLEVDYLIKSSDTRYTPGVKLFFIAIGVIVIPMSIAFIAIGIWIGGGEGLCYGLFFGIILSVLAFRVIRFTIRLGPINSTTREVSCIHYLGFCHSIFAYEYKNEQVVEAKLTKLNDKSYVYNGWKDFGGDNGGRILAFYIYCSENYSVELGQCNGAIWKKGIFQEVYREVKDFCRISGLKNNSKVGNKKYAKWIKEMS